MTSSHPDYPEAPPTTAIILGDRDPSMPLRNIVIQSVTAGEMESFNQGEGLSFHLKHLLWQPRVPAMGRVRPGEDLSDH